MNYLNAYLQFWNICVPRGLKKINKFYYFLVGTLGTSGTFGTSGTNVPRLEHFARFCCHTIFDKKALFQIIFLAIAIFTQNPVLGQNLGTSCSKPVTPNGKPPKTRLRLLNETDLPDFSKAVPIIDCGQKQFFAPFSPSNVLHPTVIVTLTEHLNELPPNPEHLKISVFKQVNGGTLYEWNTCEWEENRFQFAADGSIKFGLLRRLNYYYLIESDLSPNCSVVIWIRSDQIPIGRQSFVRCSS